MEYRKRAGFTMIEMLIVIGLIAGLMAVIMPRLMNLMGRAKVRTTQTILSQVKEGISLFNQDVGRNPKEAEGLKVLYDSKGLVSGQDQWRGPYVTLEEEDNIPLDGWKNPITYYAPPKVKKGKYKNFELISYGGESRDETNSEQKDWIVDGE